MKVFWALVRNDSKLEKDDQRTFLNQVFSIFTIILVSAGLSWTAEFINLGFIVWCLLILTPFGNAIYLLNKEWQEGSTGWWLTLPYSKSVLLSAKCIASFWRVLKIYGILFATTLIMPFVYNSFQPAFLRAQQPQFLDLLQACAKDLSWLLIISPFSITLGALIVIISRSHWAHASSLSWTGVGFGILINLYVAKAFAISPLNNLSNRNLEQGYFLSVNESYFFTPLLISLTVSALMFIFSVYLLNRHVEV
ncbi:hypothetical protein E4K67_09875 [Desulfosporosinus fructosivorans]|uniref:Uncharacterized protein n=1 Tax=Desulfosporosinus fructosivorans TaxID=2018669 RepID=A0A4Z0R7A5_9FIRM|nr:hypothetical protein [Desulfosporosinus fructosivorans]TGE38265.1 hypothetical protein E4K67_09875 [Desulfosporosinus fructosivorans]